MSKSLFFFFGWVSHGPTADWGCSNRLCIPIGPLLEEGEGWGTRRQDLRTVGGKHGSFPSVLSVEASSSAPLRATDATRHQFGVQHGLRDQRKWTKDQRRNATKASFVAPGVWISALARAAVE